MALGATLVAMVRVGRPAAAPARVIDLPARGPACLSDILAKPQVERVLLAGPERRLLTLFVRLFFWLFFPGNSFSSRPAGRRSRTNPSMMFAGRRYRFTAQACRRFARKTRNAGGDEHGSGPSSGRAGTAPRRGRLTHGEATGDRPMINANF